MTSWMSLPGQRVALAACSLSTSGGRLARTLAVAVQCGDRLLATAQTMATGIGWKTAMMPQPLAGFSHGAAGMAWALLQLATVTGIERFEYSSA